MVLISFLAIAAAVFASATQQIPVPGYENVTVPNVGILDQILQTIVAFCTGTDSGMAGYAQGLFNYLIFF